MRKIIAVYIVGVLLACLSSCASFDVELWKSKSTLNTDKKIAIEQMERIMNALQDRDAEMLKSMFAKNALAEISDIQAMIAELYDYVPCCSENMEYRGSIVGGLFEDGQRMKDHCISFWTGMELNKRAKSGIICIRADEKGYHNGKGKIQRRNETPDRQVCT